MNELRHLPKPDETVVIAGFRFVVETVTDKGIGSVIAEPE
jgi:CBS domain containing-hemolysin-like protein